MRSIKTDGIVLKRMNFSEADRILTIFTDRLGKIKVLAKGVRKISSKLASHLEPYNLIRLDLHEGKTFYTVIGSELIESYAASEKIETISRSVYMAELIDKLFEENEKNIEIFELYKNCLRQMGSDQNNLMLRLFELKILDAAGFRPDLFQCANCKSDFSSGNVFISHTTGDILCRNCIESRVGAEQINDATLKLLRLMQEKGVDVCSRIKCDIGAKDEAERILDHYLENAIERELKSKRIFL